MQSVTANGYTISFNQNGYEALNLLLQQNKYSGIYLLADSNTNEQCSTRLLQQIATDLPIEIIEIEAGEATKTIDTCVEVWKVLTELNADRKSVIINLGGGVISDLGGFVASTFKRGIDFVHVPTTLLAMVDASIGGKNGVDLGSLKNQVGVINVPKMVLIDTSFLDTLPQNEMRSGFAEMLKHGLIADRTYWERFLNLSSVDISELNSLIHRSVEIKNNIVLADPTENGIRKALNFGHTLGHAIESYFIENADKETLLHGEAVAAGMILESYLSMRLNLLSDAQYLAIKSVIKNIFPDIPVSEEDLAKVTKYLVHDKKNEYGQVQFALLDGIGQTKVGQTVENQLILDAFADYKS
ncbi:MAG TPA: 3-dehydroquinate synthase [Flavobacterium sp.]|jgi:3-dehydroquinate synthase